MGLRPNVCKQSLDLAIILSSIRCILGILQFPIAVSESLNAFKFQTLNK